MVDPTGFGKTLNDYMAPLRTSRGKGQMEDAEYWRMKAEELEDDGDADGAFDARIKWRMMMER